MTNDSNTKNYSANNPRDITKSFGGSRAVKDRSLQGLTWFAMGLSVFWLILIFRFILVNGASSVSLELIRSNYWSENIMLGYSEEGQASTFEEPEDLPETSYWSTNFGFAIEDAFSPQHKPLLRFTHIDENSPIATGRITTAGPMQGELRPPSTDSSINNLIFFDAEGTEVNVGTMFGHKADELTTLLDEEAVSLKQMYFQTAGGGIRGSLIATLQLIGITLLIAIPLGVMAAIFLHELAPKRKWVDWLRSSIEMLAGVPSVIFGLMGMTLLYPITQAFGVTGPSILLGSLTTSVLLLPTVIRQTEEALKTVPDGLRMASLALGATRTQTIARVVLPNALPGIFTSILLAMSRVIGESAALIYTTGTFINDFPKPTSGGTSLAVQIWSIMSGEQPNFRLASAISIVILGMVLVLNVLVKLITWVVRKDK